MKQVSEGIQGVVQAARMPLSVVVITILAPIVFSAVIFVFAQIPDIAKYIVGGFLGLRLW